MADLMQKKEKIERLAKSKTKLDGLPKELRGLAKVDKATKEGEVAEVQIVSVDEEAFNEAERFAGYYVQATNLCHQLISHPEKIEKRAENPLKIILF